MNNHKSPQSRITAAHVVNGIPPGDGSVPYQNIGQLLISKAMLHQDKIWMIFHSDTDPRQEILYGNFLDDVRRAAHLLHQSGIRRGDRVATVAHNHSDTIIQYFATWYLGATVVPINVGEDDQRIVYILRNSEVRFAFVRSPYLKRMIGLLSELPLLEKVVEVGSVATEEYPLYNELLWNCDREFMLVEVPSLDDEALIIYTSGTTGNPKGVVLTQYNLLVDAKGICEWHRITPEQRMMCVLPVHHVNGIVVTHLAPLYAGASVVLNRKFHTSTFFQLIEKENVNVVSVVPTLLQYLLQDETKRRDDTLHHIICGAGPLTCELAIRFEDRYRVPIIHGYGLSETTCYSCFLPLDLTEDEHRSWMDDLGFPSIGVPIPQNEMDIHDENGISLPEGTKGEIVIRGHNVMKGYFRNPQANASAFTHGWFRSGDEGFYLRDERKRVFFFITGRLKELIIRGGVNLAPLEIDEVINRCPGVKAGIAVGFENDWYGEEVGALVQKSDPELTELHVLEFCRGQLPFAKSPKIVLFTDELPVTSTGKYQRNKVKHLFRKWKDVQFRK